MLKQFQYSSFASSVFQSFVFLAGFLLINTTGIAQSSIEEFTTWPVKLKIDGCILASGGMDAAVSGVEPFLDFAGGDKAKIVVVHLQPSSKSFVGKLLNKAKADFEIFQFSKDEPDQNKVVAEIKNASGVVLVAESEMDRESVNFFDQCLPELKTVLQQDGVIWAIGSVTSRLGHFKNQSDLGMSLLTEESGLVPNAILFHNYNHTVGRSGLFSALAAQPDSVGVGISSDATIILKGRKLVVVGEGTATFALTANERAPFRVQHVKSGSAENRNPYDTTIDLTAWRREAIDRNMPMFPSESPAAPNVEKGTLFIVGGGGLPDGMMKDMIDRAGGEKSKWVYVPCSEKNEISGEPEMLSKWRELGVDSIVVLHTKDRNRANSDAEFLSPLADATGIWFGGGRQWNFADSYYGTKAHRMMKEVLSRGGVIGGSSAGASIQADYLARANPVANLDIMAPGYERGLGFITGVAIDQHFTQRGRQKDMTQLVDRYPQLLGIGIDESTALVVQGSIAKVIGEGEVYFYDRNRPVVKDEPDYVVLGSGKNFDLAKRVVTDTTIAAVGAESPPKGSSVPNGELIQKAVARLIARQEEDGAWPYEGVYRVGGKIPVGYRIGGTSIACQALLASPLADRSQIVKPVKRGVELVLRELEDRRMRVSTRDRYDVRVWGHIYALQMFCSLQGQKEFADEARMTKPWITKLAGILIEEELDEGGWNYATRRSHAPFVTSPAAQALLSARELGVEIPDEVFKKTVAALLASRSKTGAYQYSGTVSGSRPDLLPGSIARGAVSETTLMLLGEGSVDHVRAAINAFHEHWDELEKRRQKTGTHVAPYGVAPYYFYYGHRYLAQAIQMLPQDEQVKEYERFEEVLLRTKEEDDSWNDRVFERSKAFGTAMSLLALARANDKLPSSIKK